MKDEARARELRGAALLPLAALALHALRYSLWYGPGAHRALARQGHAYLTGLAPLLVGFAAALAGVALARAWAAPGRAARPRTSFARAALSAAAALVAIFVLQETLEGLLAAGHPGGAAAVLAHGGRLAVPLALLLGAAVALLVRAGEALAAAAPGARLARPARALLAPAAHRLLPLPRTPSARGLARPGAGRAPPPAAALLTLRG